MSTQEQRDRFYAFADWAKRRVTMDGYPAFTAQDAWNAAWVAAEAVAIERCARRVERMPLDLFGMPPEMRITARAHVADDLRALLPKEES